MLHKGSLQLQPDKKPSKRLNVSPEHNYRAAFAVTEILIAPIVLIGLRDITATRRGTPTQTPTRTLTPTESALIRTMPPLPLNRNNQRLPIYELWPSKVKVGWKPPPPPLPHAHTQKLTQLSPRDLTQDISWEKGQHKETPLKTSPVTAR